MKPKRHFTGLYCVVWAAKRENRLSSSIYGRGQEKISKGSPKKRKFYVAYMPSGR